MRSGDAEKPMFPGGAAGGNVQQMQRSPNPLKVSSPLARRRQAAAAVAAAGGCFVNGCLVGYTAATGPEFASIRPTLDVYGNPLKSSMQNLSWIVSLLFLGSFFGTLCSFFLLDKLGRRSILGFLCGGLFSTSHALVFFASDLSYVMAGRFVGGIGLGLQAAAAAAYIQETTKRDVRGAAAFLGTQLPAAAGAAAAVWLGAAVAPRWWVVALLGFAASLPAAAAALFWAPESPHFLLSRGREYSAAKSLEWLRGRQDDDIDRELEALKRDLTRQRREERTGLSALAADRSSSVRPLLLSLALMFLLAFSGTHVVVLYLGNILIHTMSVDSLSISATVAIVAVFLPVSSLLSALLVSRLPNHRRLVSSASALLSSGCLLTLGFCLRAAEDSLASVHRDLLSPRAEAAERLGIDPGLPDTDYSAAVYLRHAPPAYAAGWLPVAALCLFVLFSNGGFGTLAWVIAADIAPERLRTTLSRATALSFHACLFVASKTFGDLVQSSISMSGAVFVSAAFALCLAIFVSFVTPASAERVTVQHDDSDAAANNSLFQRFVKGSSGKK